ncbi:MAG TPA: signal peptide peptidase SppA [Bryobacteraceae bacterium]|nr:signal peptide peptidase SppA [Bryobacteraceae bacterium]
MKNFFIGLVVGILFSGLVLFILFFAAVRLAGSFAARTTTVSDNSMLVLNLNGDLPEIAPPEIPVPFIEAQTPLAVYQVWEIFRRAASDPRIKGIVLEPRGLGIGFAKLQEIQQEIAQFKKSGKPIVTYLRSPGAREYYLACATDRIFLGPEDELDLKGMRVESVFLKTGLEKIGVNVDVIHAGKYKDAGDMFTRTSMSPETQEVLNDVLNQYYGSLVNDIAQGRRKQPDQVKALIDQGPFIASDALNNALVDSLGYEDQAIENLKNRANNSNLKRVSGKAYLKAPQNSSGIANRIALVVGEGDITTGSGNESANDQGFTSTGFVKLLRQVGNDSSIKGVILRIDSPGGDGTASDDILHEAKNLSKKKPVIISMSDLAASGGYLASMTGDPIVAYPNTLTGSIGVLLIRPNLHGLYDKLGIGKQGLSRGRFADLDSEYVPLTPELRDKLASEVDAFYKGFINVVAQGRRRPADQIESLAQGRVWLGAQAKQNGLVDDLGGLDRAIELLKQKAHIGATERITLVPYPGKRSVLDMLFSRSDDFAEVEAKVGIRKLLGHIPIEALARGGFMKLMPYSIEVK